MITNNNENNVNNGKKKNRNARYPKPMYMKLRFKPWGYVNVLIVEWVEGT